MNELDAIFTRYYLQLIKSIAALRNCYSRKDPYFSFLGVLTGSGLCLGQSDAQLLGNRLAEFLHVLLVEFVGVSFEFFVVAEVFESFEVHASQVFWGYFVILFFVLIVIFILLAVFRLIVFVFLIGIFVVFVGVFILVVFVLVI